MSKKSEVKLYAKILAQKLLAAPAGEHTVAQLIHEHLGHLDASDETLFFDIHDALAKEMEIEGYLLDSSAYNRKPMGLPFFIPFVLTKIERPQHLKVKCPHCGKSNAVEYIYGMPTGEAMKQAECGDVILKGCCITGNESRYRCTICKRQFGKPPFFEAQYRDIPLCEVIPAFSYEYGGFFGGLYQLQMDRDVNGYRVRLSHSYKSPDESKMSPKIREDAVIDEQGVTFRITAAQFERFIRKLYDKTMLADWKHRYAETGVLDGASMTMKIGSQKYSCDNQWPPYYEELNKIVGKWFEDAGYDYE